MYLKRVHRTLVYTLILGVIAALATPVCPATAAPSFISAQEVINTVNALRASQGLSPYMVDGGIMAYAQAHSEYQASIGQSTHTHSDGQNSLSDGLQENIAGGSASLLTAEFIVYEIWADAVHMKTMVGYTTGSVGAGVAISGGTAYVTLNVRAGSAVTVPNLPGGASGIGAIYTPIALVPLYTVTPKSNGAVIHEVGYGQSLWAIAVAYGVTGDRIRSLNGMAPGQTDIYAGQKLLIVPAGAITPQPTPTPPVELAALPPLPTLAPISPTPGPTATHVPALTQVPTPSKVSGRLNLTGRIDPILLGLAGLAGLGLLLVLSSGVRINRRTR